MCFSVSLDVELNVQMSIGHRSLAQAMVLMKLSVSWMGFAVLLKIRNRWYFEKWMYLFITRGCRGEQERYSTFRVIMPVLMRNCLRMANRVKISVHSNGLFILSVIFLRTILLIGSVFFELVNKFLGSCFSLGKMISLLRNEIWCFECHTLDLVHIAWWRSDLCLSSSHMYSWMQRNYLRTLRMFFEPHSLRLDPWLSQGVPKTLRWYRWGSSIIQNYLRTVRIINDWRWIGIPSYSLFILLLLASTRADC